MRRWTAWRYGATFADQLSTYPLGDSTCYVSGGHGSDEDYEERVEVLPPTRP